MRGLLVSKGKLYPGYRLPLSVSLSLSLITRFAVGGNHRERSSNERVARPPGTPLVFARWRFIEILFLWPASTRADAWWDTAARKRTKKREETTDQRRREESPLLLISFAFLHPSLPISSVAISISLCPTHYHVASHFSYPLLLCMYFSLTHLPACLVRTHRAISLPRYRGALYSFF